MKWHSPSPVDSKIMLVRPLLDATKAELRGFAREDKIRFREDATNTSLDQPRNRVRNELLPLLQRRYQPALAKTVLRLMEIVGAEADLVGEIARQWLKKTGGDGPPGRPRTPRRGVPTFKDLPVAVQRRSLQLQLSEAGVTADFELIESLRQSADVPVSLGPQLSVLRDATGVVSLRVARPSVFKANETAVKLAGRAGEVIFDGVRVRWRFDALKKFKRPAARPAGESFDADKVGGGITLRHWRPGDRFQPIGLKSPVKLQDLFTNRKIPRARRRELIVAVAENEEIFWVEGLRISENFKLTPRTRRRLAWRWRHLAGLSKTA
jgi:tRNA(Ile)-lysidine synthase